MTAATLPACEDIEVATPQDLTDLLAASLRDMVTHIEAHQASLAPSNRGCYCASLSAIPMCKPCLAKRARRVLAEYDAERAEAAEFDRDEREREMEEAR